MNTDNIKMFGRVWAVLPLSMLPVLSMAQGNNDGLGEDPTDLKSIYEMVSKQEKKNKALNLYFNYGASYQMNHDSREGAWTSRFYNRYLKVEMTGWLTDNLYYRFRHRLNKSNVAQSEDNFAKATDYMMVGWKFNGHWAIQGGKKCQALGSFEFDENPLYIYQYSDIEDNVDSSKGALNLLYNPTPDQQFTAEVSNTYNGKLEDEFGENAKVTSQGYVDGGGVTYLKTETLEKANHPLAYTVEWNGKFFDGKLQTRWSYTLRTQAKHKYSRFLRMGQKLNLNKLQWYLDYNMTYDDLDRMKIATGEIVDALKNTFRPYSASSSKTLVAAEMASSSETISPTDASESDDFTNLYVGKVRYQGLVTKVNWQFAPAWNLMLKGMWETASMTKTEEFKSYRKAFGYVGSIEYYPARKQQQDLRVFLAYTGRKYDYSQRCGLKNYNTDRIELGIMYRLKAY